MNKPEEAMRVADRGASDQWRPRVSALVPAYNSAEFITNTLQSLAEQTWPDLEVIIGDDCSTDETLEVVRRFAAEHPNVTVLARQQNLGWIGNSNDLMSRATGELMFFAFHDDVIATDYVEKMVRALSTDPTAILAFSDLELVHVHGSRQLVTYPALDGVRNPVMRGLAMAHRQGNWWAAIHGVFRRTAFDRTGGLAPHEAGEKSADWPWMLALALMGPFVRVPEVLCFKTYKASSLSLSWERGAEYRRALRSAAERVVQGSRLPWWGKKLLIADVRRTWAMPPALRGAGRTLLKVSRSLGDRVRGFSDMLPRGSS